jgi:hypothetical protein
VNTGPQNAKSTSASAPHRNTASIQSHRMFRFRFLLACLVMLAIPLQGFAAASMLCCSGDMVNDSGKQVRSEFSENGMRTDEARAHPQAYVHDHSTHVHSGVTQQQQSSEKAQVVSTPQVTAKTLLTGTHTCNVCSACCQSAAISESMVSHPVAPIPQADLIEPAVLLVSRPAVVPDKPPRI